MMGEFLGVAAAVMFGASHFFNGVLSRRTAATSVAVCSQLGGALFFLLWVLSSAWTQSTVETMSQADSGWAALSGLGAGIGVAALYEGMRRYNISLVVPVASVVSVAVPFILSIAILGESLQLHTATAGMLLIPAIWLLSRSHHTPSSPPKGRGTGAAGGQRNVVAAVFGLISGSGYATQLFALSQINSANPAEPLLAGQLVSLIPLLLLLWVRGTSLRANKATFQAAAIGIMAALAMAFYLYATRYALLGPVMVAIALYPALPVLLALLVLKERLNRAQTTGLAIAATVVPIATLAN